ncbi:hypothetical protein PROFUN_10887 [Planoprotostelium fungivorum]|uniref:Uncharacterized protein n=1 Tax=Planoprotostelium fungivorum TaxID=1890364 RepID=A0A2P6NC51_9EUKA|nr:hypothetical protein PROFUN_10887 [Planoprotostelium fungivorum]
MPTTVNVIVYLRLSQTSFDTMTCKCTRNAVPYVSGYNLPAYEREIFIESKTATYEGRQMTIWKQH